MESCDLSELWDFSTAESKKYFNACKTSTKLAWNVPRGCRSYLIQHVLAPRTFSARTKILSRFHGFFLSLKDSVSHEVSVCAHLSARDVRSNLGKNLKLLREETDLEPWTADRVQMKLAIHRKEQVEIEANDYWRIDFLSKLLDDRIQAVYNLDEKSETYITSLINSLVIN